MVNIILKLYLITMISLILIVKLIDKLKHHRFLDELQYTIICLILFYIPILVYIIFN